MPISNNLLQFRSSKVGKKSMAPGTPKATKQAQMVGLVGYHLESASPNHEKHHGKNDERNHGKNPGDEKAVVMADGL